MKNLYYAIWSDAILSFKEHHPNRTDCKSVLFIMITWMHALNLWIIILWLKYFDILTLPKFELNLFPGSMINNFIIFAIEFALPFCVLNYFLIFHKNRYLKIVDKYKEVKTRFAPIYSFIIIFTALFSAFLYGYLTS